MKTVLAAAALLAVASSPPARAEAFDPFTGYFVLGKAPRGAADFKYFEISGPGGSENRKSPRIQGSVVTDLSDPNKGDAPIKRAAIKGRAIEFATAKNEFGVSFTFRGRFLRGGRLAKFSMHRVPLLSGTRVKLKNNKEVARGPIRFYGHDSAG